MYPVIGARDLVIAKLNEDTDTALTYDTVEKIEGVISISLTDNSGDAEPYYADDVEKGRINKQAKIGVTIELLAAEIATIATFFGHTVDADGVMAKKDGDTPPYLALGFKAATVAEAGGDDGLWLKKCIATGRTNAMSYQTKEGETVTKQTVKIELEAIPTIHDKEYMLQTNSKDSGMETKWATWFDEVPGATA